MSAERLRAPALALLVGVLVLLGGCERVPEGIEPVTGFDLERYLGRWYEIARLDHGFERGLSHVTAEYAMREDGGVSVVNRGWNAGEGEWEEADGRAYFVSGPDTGHLKVSFFGPFYGGYVVFHLDREDYRWALVSGPTRSYFWLLARDRALDPALEAELLDVAAAAGFDMDEIIRVEQADPPPHD